MKKLILMGLLLSVNHVFAESAAKVLFTEKKVMANRNGSERVLSRGASVEAGDQIVTGEGAAANIQYSNGTLVNIGANSNYKILAYSPKESVQIKAELSNGKIEQENPGKIKETLKTPIVSLAILGTHIRVDVTSAKMTYLNVIEGLVLARNEFIRAGDSVRVTGDRIVNAPFPKDGLVNSPLNSAGKIQSSAATTSTYTETQASTSSGATTTAAINNSQVTGTSTTTSTGSVQSASSVATLVLSCS